MKAFLHLLIPRTAGAIFADAIMILAIAAALALTGRGSVAYPPPPTPPPATISPFIPGTPSPTYTWPATATCGRERWPVKTATDPTAAKISGTAVPATLYSLVHKPRPADLPQDQR